MKGLTVLWMCLCCLRPDEVAKVLPQSGQACARAPTCCERMCRCRLLGSVNTWERKRLEGGHGAAGEERLCEKLGDVCRLLPPPLLVLGGQGVHLLHNVTCHLGRCSSTQRWVPRGKAELHSHSDLSPCHHPPPHGQASKAGWRVSPWAPSPGPRACPRQSCSRSPRPAPYLNTVFTFKPFPAVVRHLVPNQVGFPVESLGTLVALVLALLGVDHHVLLQAGGQRHRLSHPDRHRGHSTHRHGTRFETQREGYRW